MHDRDVARARAARELASGSTKAAAARAAEVDPGTITKWLKDSAFRDLILKAQQPADTPDQMAVQGLADLVPQALRLLKDAMEGAQITPAQQNVALSIIDKAKKWEPAKSTQGPSTLAAAIQEIDGT